MQQKPNERYDKRIHGGLEKWSWGKPQQRGHYTVICNVRNHYWVKYRYFFNGADWITPGHSLTQSVVMYLPDSLEVP